MQQLIVGLMWFGIRSKYGIGRKLTALLVSRLFVVWAITNWPLKKAVCGFWVRWFGLGLMVVQDLRIVVGSGEMAIYGVDGLVEGRSIGWEDDVCLIKSLVYGRGNVRLQGQGCTLPLGIAPFQDFGGDCRDLGLKSLHPSAKGAALCVAGSGN